MTMIIIPVHNQLSLNKTSRLCTFNPEDTPTMNLCTGGTKRLAKARCQSRISAISSVPPTRLLHRCVSGVIGLGGATPFAQRDQLFSEDLPSPNRTLRVQRNRYRKQRRSRWSGSYFAVELNTFRRGFKRIWKCL